MRAEANQQAEPAPLALTRSCDALLDDAATQVRINEPSPCPINGVDQAGVINAILASEFCERLGFENTHKRLSRSINYSL